MNLPQWAVALVLSGAILVPSLPFHLLGLEGLVGSLPASAILAQVGCAAGQG